MSTESPAARVSKTLLRATTTAMAAVCLPCLLLFIFDISLKVSQRFGFLPFELGILAAVGMSLFALWDPRPWRRVLAAGALMQFFALLALGLLALDLPSNASPVPLWLPFLTFGRMLWLTTIGLVAALASLAVESHGAVARQPVTAVADPGAVWQVPSGHRKQPVWLCDTRGWRYFLRTVAAGTVIGYGAWLVYFQIDWPAARLETKVLRLWLAFAWTFLWSLAIIVPWRPTRLMSHAVATGLAGWCMLLWLLQLTTWSAHRGSVTARWWLIVYTALTIVSLLAAWGIANLLRWELHRGRGAPLALPPEEDDAGTTAAWDLAQRNQHGAS